MYVAAWSNEVLAGQLFHRNLPGRTDSDLSEGGRNGGGVG